ncbi:CLUMA_CG013396, isoform A [Clunio marinus]|uniref:CLUMA_CG013396, isoform A n=1 Tax=Clunio marinus TaxID=568069 RepID=A0A1J1IIR8_9DIPT|nr:CLUMA_CG013396, isoform A [Clunio marinus]
MGLSRILKSFPTISFAWFYLFIMLENADAKIGYFWHITDLHFDSAYSTKGDIVRSCWHTEHHQSTSRAPGYYGDYLCDSPWTLLETASQAMREKQGDNVEFVLWTGDGLSHSARRSSESHRLELLRNITELLGRTFPSQFVFPVLGHEDVQNNDYKDYKNFLVSLGNIWRQWLPLEALQTFEKGGYYTIEQTKSRLRIVVLNTNFMRHDFKYSQSHLSAVRQRPDGSVLGQQQYNMGYHRKHYHHDNDEHNTNNNFNRYNKDRYYGSHSNSDEARLNLQNGAGENGAIVSALSVSHESEKQWEWLEDVLAKSNRNKETVYIVGHMPPGSDERQIGIIPNGHTTYSEKNNLRYLRLIRKYSSIIQGQFFGHLHSDSFRIVYNDMGKPVSWIMIAPSITPRKMLGGSNNPAMRLYKFETDTGQVLDYTQYYLDLESANSRKDGAPAWQSEYNLTTYYHGLGEISREISAVSLHNLADRFTNPEDILFSKYYRANSVRFPTQPCEGVCSLNHYCAITRIDYREYRQCLETAASALASRTRSNQDDLNNKILLLLIAFIQLFVHQQFVSTQIILNAICSKLNVVQGFKNAVSIFKVMNLKKTQKNC